MVTREWEGVGKKVVIVTVLAGGGRGGSSELTREIMERGARFQVQIE